ARRRPRVMQREQDAVLFKPGGALKPFPEQKVRDLGDRNQPQAVGIPIGRHVREAVAFDASSEQAGVNRLQHRNLVFLVAVVLRQDAVANRPHENGLLGRKKTDSFMPPDTLEHHLARGLVPEFRLLQRVEAGIIAGLAAGAHYFGFFRSRLASMPRKPQAANNSGARIGGPYRTL